MYIRKMRLLSVDPGVTSIGLAWWDGEIKVTGNLRLVPSSCSYPEWKKKYGSKTEGMIISNLLAFLRNSEWGDWFSKAQIVVFESNTFTFSHALCFALVCWLRIYNPDCVSHFVFPSSISKFYKIGGLSRHERKAKIRELVFEKVPRLASEWKSKEVSQDELDATLNIFYFQERRKSKDPPPQCPHWSCVSLQLNKP